MRGGRERTVSHKTLGTSTVRERADQEEIRRGLEKGWSEWCEEEEDRSTLEAKEVEIIKKRKD